MLVVDDGGVFVKRSEMIKNIAKYLKSHYSSMSEPALDNFNLTADCLLDDLEYLGMMPPKRWRNKDWKEKGITYSEWVQLESKVNKWDDEDES